LGIGGSAMAGELIKNYLKYLDTSNNTEIIVSNGTDIPKNISKNTFVFCCSYSGNTAETLSALDKVKNKSDNIIAITSGGKLAQIAKENNYTLLTIPTGMMPRCAMFYSYFYLLNAMQELNVTGNSKKDIDSAIEEITSEKFTKSLDYSAIDNNNIALVLARLCEGKIPIIYTGDERLKAVNLRWRGQVQENANQLCFGNYFPELNHNEINGWMFPPDLLDRFVVIAMKDIDDSDALNTTMSNALNILRQRGIEVIEVVVAGHTLLERIIRLVCIADWFSFYLAIMNNTDPTPIPLITALKNNVVKE
jgi:glucose/mannose-6-phosphate isomerase